ncbi:DUF1653 domain-containing protein [Patescibacteria group bacterium]|nr:DUF1653 domain-containing protein [Patescibacteria group bacterium]MBU1500835.1 DUF1653 domain-containing protein [Patescibacteria group bacterium]MBU2080890.1 DUF1653 domain-containing protein [Patescibacteria group bacterium]MBU2123995.1 DUF1653 domain-containing protein [Patescibacteria group bacterium]MBU2194714.1 DUF1653 domain-containing protein [Patescibacteria group bacterium]
MNKEEVIQSGKTYQHYKGGLYTVLFVTEETTNERKGNAGGVVYVSHTYGKIKHRDVDEFVEEIEWPDGVVRPRFILLGEE